MSFFWLKKSKSKESSKLITSWSNFLALRLRNSKPTTCVPDNRIRLDLTSRIKPLIPASSPLRSLDLEKLKQLRILAGVEEDEGQKRKKSEQNPGLLSYKNIGGDGFLLTDGLATEIVQMESGDQVSLTKSYSKVPNIISCRSK